MTNRWSFEQVTFDGCNAGLEINSDSPTRGGTNTAGGDASWGYVGNSHFNQNKTGLYQRYSGGFEVHGSSFTGPEPQADGDTHIYTNGGGQVRVHDNKFVLPYVRHLSRFFAHVSMRSLRKKQNTPF